MSWWEGRMNWPLNKDWKCEICGEHTDLEWGMLHARCRCSQCHVQYHMKDKEDNIVSIPICMIKDEYRKPTQYGWSKFHRPIDTFTDTEWDELIRESQ